MTALQIAAFGFICIVVGFYFGMSIMALIASSNGEDTPEEDEEQSSAIGLYDWNGMSVDEYETLHRRG